MNTECSPQCPVVSKWFCGVLLAVCARNEPLCCGVTAAEVWRSIGICHKEMIAGIRGVSILQFFFPRKWKALTSLSGKKLLCFFFLKNSFKTILFNHLALVPFAAAPGEAPAMCVVGKGRHVCTPVPGDGF